MVRILALFACVIALPLSAQALVVYRCPSTIDAGKQTAKLPKDFSLWQQGADHRLSGLTLYDGHPREIASLVPDNEDSAGKEEAFWTLDPDNKRGYWLECLYDHTNLTLIKRLDAVQRCSTIQAPSENGVGTPALLGLKCN